MIKQRKENAIEKSDKYINEFDVFLLYLFLFCSRKRVDDINKISSHRMDD